MGKFWTKTQTLPYKIMYEETEQIKKDYGKLLNEYKSLLTKVDSISKLLKQIVSILLSYNPKLAEQTQEQLEKINEESDYSRNKPRSDISR